MVEPIDIFTHRGGRRLQYTWDGKDLRALPVEDVESMRHGTSEDFWHFQPVMGFNGIRREQKYLL